MTVSQTTTDNNQPRSPRRQPQAKEEHIIDLIADDEDDEEAVRIVHVTPARSTIARHGPQSRGVNPGGDEEVSEPVQDGIIGMKVRTPNRSAQS